jgi:hypothetical protein
MRRTPATFEDSRSSEANWLIDAIMRS